MDKLVEAVNALLTVCDGAHSLDGAGFNKIDGRFIRSLPEPRQWSPKQRLAVYNCLKKYTGQLQSFSLSFYDIPKPEVPAEVKERAAGIVSKFDDNTVSISFPYSPALVNAVKTLGNYPELRYEASTRRWLAATSLWKGIKAFVNAASIFMVDTEAAELLEKAERQPSAKRSSDKLITLAGDEVRISFPFTRDTVDRVKKYCPSAKWNKAGAYWHARMCIGTIEGLTEFLKHSPGFEVSKEYAQAVKSLTEKAVQNVEMSRSDSAELDLEGFLKPPRPFQKQGIIYGIQNERTFIADAQGLGKTIQALGIIHALALLPTLAIPPAGLKVNWGIEAAACLPGANRQFYTSQKQPKRDWYDQAGNYQASSFSYAQLHGSLLGSAPELVVVVCDSKTPDWVIQKADICILNYDNLSAGWESPAKKRVNLTPVVEDIRKKGLKCVIVDESHRIKNSKAQRTRACWQIADGIKHRYALTGTPVQNRPNEVPAQLKFLGRLDEFGGEWNFLKRYCAAKQVYAGRRLVWDFSGVSNADELNTRMRASCFIRRTKDQVLKELPPKTWVQIECELSNRPEYVRVEKDLAGYLMELNNAREEGEPLRSMQATALQKIGLLRQLAAKGKLESIKEWIHDFLEDPEEKLVIFAHHREIQDELLKICADYNPTHVLGSDDQVKARPANVQKFQTDKTCRVIVCSLEAASEGITLTAARSVLFVELPWTPGKKEQAEDRCHRIGQQNAVTIYDALAVDSFDQDMFDLLRTKSEIASAVVDGVDSTNSRLISEISARLLARQ